MKTIELHIRPAKRPIRIVIDKIEAITPGEKGVGTDVYTGSGENPFMVTENYEQVRLLIERADIKLFN